MHVLNDFDVVPVADMFVTASAVQVELRRAAVPYVLALVLLHSQFVLEYGLDLELQDLNGKNT